MIAWGVIHLDTVVLLATLGWLLWARPDRDRRPGDRQDRIKRRTKK